MNTFASWPLDSAPAWLIIVWAIMGEYPNYDAVIPFTENAVTYIPAPFPPRQDRGIDFSLFYSDCVTPTT